MKGKQGERSFAMKKEFAGSVKHQGHAEAMWLRKGWTVHLQNEKENKNYVFISKMIFLKETNSSP